MYRAVHSLDTEQYETIYTEPVPGTELIPLPNIFFPLGCLLRSKKVTLED